MTARLRFALTLVVCMAFLAAACGGEVTDSDEGDAAAPTTQAPDAAEPDDPDEAPDDEPTTTEPADSDLAPDDEPTTTEPADSDEPPDDEPTTTTEPEGPPPNIFDDPRDGIFDEYQAAMDRGDHPFMQVDEFCRTHEPAPDRVATDKGIEADSISLVHIRSKLEDFAAIGFGTDVGDPAEMFETLVAVVNEQCGGVRGRTIDLHTIHVNVLGDTLDEERNAACIEAIEDRDAVIVVNSSGFQGSATLCMVEEHETPFITVQPQGEEFMRRSGDRLITMTPTAEEALGWLAQDLIDRGELDGKTVGIAAPDTPGQFEQVEAGLVNLLRDNGVNVAVFDQLGCGGTIVCMDGARETVSRMRSEGVDVVFNVLNVISAPQFLNEMLNQGFEPGDVQFYASDFKLAGLRDRGVQDRPIRRGGSRGPLQRRPDHGLPRHRRLPGGGLRAEGVQRDVQRHLRRQQPLGDQPRVAGPPRRQLEVRNGQLGVHGPAHGAAGDLRGGRQPHPGRHQ